MLPFSYLPASEVVKIFHKNLFQDIRIWDSNDRSPALEITETKKTGNIKWATSWGNLFMLYANNKDAEQPAHLRSLISTFVAA